RAQTIHTTTIQTMHGTRLNGPRQAKYQGSLRPAARPRAIHRAIKPHLVSVSFDLSGQADRGEWLPRGCGQTLPPQRIRDSTDKPGPFPRRIPECGRAVT